jgi:hypothetical protein
MASKIELISNALILIGDLPINTLTGNSRAQTVAANLYENIVLNELTKFRWGFARRKAQLSLLTGEPIEEWEKAYQLPSDILTLIKVSPNVNYQVYGSKAYTNYAQALYCDYIANVAESEWPSYFNKMIEYALARDFASSIRDSASSADRMAAEYLNASRMARYTDAQQHKTVAIVSRPFVDVRF